MTASRFDLLKKFVLNAISDDYQNLTEIVKDIMEKRGQPEQPRNSRDGPARPN
jgi:hypothetical protein